MTIRASYCLAAIAGAMAFFAIGPAHAGSGLGGPLKSFTPSENIVTTAGYEHEHRRYARRCYDRWEDEDRCKRWAHRRYWHHRYVKRHRDKCCRPHHRKRHVRRHRHRHKHAHRRPFVGRNYDIYTYRKPRAPDPNMDVQWVYGLYKGYYYPYPRYPGVGYGY